MKKLKILRILLSFGETSGPYNLLSLPLAQKQEITICTYFKSSVTVPQNIRLIDGNDSLSGFLRGLRTAFSQKEYDIIHAHTMHVGILHLLFSLFFRRKNGTVFTVHNSFNNFKLRNRLMLIPNFAFFQRIVFCGHTSFESFPSYFLRIAGKRSRVVKNGVDLARIDGLLNKKSTQCQKDNFTVVTVGRLINIKNHFILLNAFKKVHEANDTLVIIGEGHLHNLLLRKIEENTITKNTYLTGLIPRESVFEYLSRGSLFVSASHGEGLPIAVLEAMACRCPVVLSDIPPHREIADGVDFIQLVAPNDIDGFAQAIRKFKYMPYSERIEIGVKCRKLVEERFSLKAMHKGYREVYREVLKS